MKILLVDQFGKTTGRDTLALAELINQNDDVEMEVYLSDNTELPKDKVYSVKTVRGFKNAYIGSAVNKAINYLKALYQLYRYIDKNNFDIIHLQWFSLPWIEWMFVGKLAKKHKVVITVHDVIPFDNRPFEMMTLDMIYSRADILLMHTNSGKELFKKNYKANTPISIITQGFCSKSDYKRIDNAKAKEHFGISENSIVFLYYGTIRPSKGFDILIKAIHKAHEINDKVYLLAAGAFHKINESELRTLVKNELSKEFSTVNFEFVPQNEEQWYFSAADVLCLPYLEVTQSGVAQLGLMYELPIIATDVGEMKDVCKDGVNGLIVEKNSVEDLTDKMIQIANNEGYRDMASRNSAYLAENDFSLRKKAEYVVNSYRM